jgi:hypothetical protein
VVFRSSCRAITEGLHVFKPLYQAFRPDEAVTGHDGDIIRRSSSTPNRCAHRAARTLSERLFCEHGPKALVCSSSPSLMGVSGNLDHSCRKDPRIQHTVVGRNEQDRGAGKVIHAQASRELAKTC